MLSMLTPERIPVWITKYALTRGIVRAEAVPGGCKDGYRCFTPGVSNGWILLTAGLECELSEAAAVARFEQMRARKIAALDRQKAKLASLQPKIVDRLHESPENEPEDS